MAVSLITLTLTAGWSKITHRAGCVESEKERQHGGREECGVGWERGMGGGGEREKGLD